MTIPLKNVKGVKIEEDIKLNFETAFKKLYGTNFPFVYFGGAFLQNNEKVFWDVRIPEKTIGISLENENFDKLVIEVDNPEDAVNKIAAAVEDFSGKATTIAAMRKKNGITQEELANEVGVTRQTIISLENGKYTASLPLAFKISRYFGVKIEDIFEYFEEEK
jgi:putative transcriptional regulator